MKTFTGHLALALTVLLNTTTFSQQHGSWAGTHNGGGYSGAVADQGYTMSRTDDWAGFTRSSSIDSARGLNTSYTYAVRMPDGRRIVNSHHLGISDGSAFYGSGRASGYSAVEAGGRITGPGMGSTYGWAHPSIYGPAWSQTISRSYP